MAKAAKTPVKMGGGPLGGPKTPQMKMKTPNKPGRTPNNPLMSPQSQAPQVKTPKNKTPKPKVDTPHPGSAKIPAQNGQSNKKPKQQQQQPQQQQQQQQQQQPQHKQQQQPQHKQQQQQPQHKQQQQQPQQPQQHKQPQHKQQQQQQQKQKPQQQQKQLDPPKQQHQSSKQANEKGGKRSDATREVSSRTVRLTFPDGALKSVEQVKKLAPTATSVKFPNVAFVEFSTEAETEKQHGKLLALISDGQLVQVNFLGEKERQYQNTNRGLDNTRLFVRGVGGATEGDIRKLFPSAKEIIIPNAPHMRHQPQSRQKQHSYCFVVYSTAAACLEALEKSKGLTLFGNPLTVSFAFARKDAPREAGDGQAAVKRPAEVAEVTAAAKKAKTEVQAQDDDEEDEEDEEEGEDEGEEEEDEDEEGDDDDDDGDNADDDDDDGEDDDDDEDEEGE